MNTLYFNKFKNSANITFLPYVGNLYGQNGSIFKGNKTLLILGESYYCDPFENEQRCRKDLNICDASQNQACRDYAKQLICKEHVADRNAGKKNKWTISHLSCEKAFFGQEPTSEQRDSFWNSVSFYNFYVQAQPGPSRPLTFSPLTVERSQKAFIEVINILRPDAIICWGQRTWNNLPNSGFSGGEIKGEGVCGKIWCYPFENNNGETKVLLHKPHPSRPLGKSFTRWHKIYNEFLKDFCDLL